LEAAEHHPQPRLVPAAPEADPAAEIERLQLLVQHLEDALRNRVKIEQAKGVLAERFDLMPDEAFQLLRRAARTHRRPVRRLAADVTASRSTPREIEEVLLGRRRVLDRDEPRLDSVAERATRAQMVFREVNERISELTESLLDPDIKLFVCECSDEDCADALEVTADEYEAVRRDGARFLVLPGHELAEVEKVVAATDRYRVVEKVGEAGVLATRSDPRGSDDDGWAAGRRT
jgi:hypothetical protein